MSKRDHEFKVLLSSKADCSDPGLGFHALGAKSRNFVQTIAHIYTSWANDISIDVASSIAVGTPVYRLSSKPTEPVSKIAEKSTDDAGIADKKHAGHGLLAGLEKVFILIGTLGEADQFARRR
ncbi:hypothetical protein [Bradyrhizobium sp. BR13661]|jgi:hypothetical protein|uniref:hypothetical protein n=1 Tax=Bradyrhizobium sp. BR13661 TaxID=2940622 RepID=UPI002475B466|nr:hypothetical protein [Bradyrhizobium sp. BR13661]MDH6261764.1 hypothetical protein [Bradyrhizobium sp. BR13661]